LRHRPIAVIPVSLMAHGFAAGDANHCRANAKRRQQLLYNICEALESALGCL